MRFKRNLYLAVICCLWTYASSAQTTIVVSDTGSVTSIGRQAYYFEDKSITLPFEQILSAQYQRQFIPAVSEAPNFGITPHGIWCKAVIRNDTRGPVYLHIDNPILDTITFYKRNKDGTYTVVESGTHIYPPYRSFYLASFLFPLHLQPGDSATYYIRAAANSPMQLPLYAGTMKSFIKQLNGDELFHGCYYGIIIIMILYNLFLFFSIRDRVYLYYIAYALFIGIFNAGIYGHLIYLDDGVLQNWISRRMITMASVIMLAMVLFSTKFLNTKVNAPKFHRYLTVITVLLAIPVCIELSGDVWNADNVVNLFSVVIPFSLLMTGIYVYRKGYKAAKFYIIAWIPFLVSIIVFTLAMQNIIPSTALTKKSMELGSAFEVLLISLALADRINVYKAEREQAQHQLLLSSRENERLVRNQNVLLEQKVTERTHELAIEKKKSDDLLLNILPEEIAAELKEKGSTKAKQFDNVTVLFTDFAGFTKISEQLTPQQLVDELDACFKAFDGIMDKYGIEKIKTVGDAYLAACGLPAYHEWHAERVVDAAREIILFMQRRRSEMGDRTFRVRIGIHSGSVVAGIVGVKKFAYDIWGDTVNTAARMEQNSEPGKINLSETTYGLVKDRFDCTYRGEIAAKHKGALKMYFVNV